MSAQIILPRLLQVGAGASQQVGSIAQSLGGSRALIITDPIMVQLGYVAAVQANLSAANITSDVFADTVPEPTDTSIVAGVSMLREGDYDCLVAIGGGSPIDSAKAIGVLGRFGGEMRDYKVPRVFNEQGLPLIAIPTTAGTGSEATQFTVITDATSDEKMLCKGVGFMPTAALVDYELTLSVPPRTTADTAIDSLTHAMEAYVSKKANPYTDAQALQAMQLIAPNLRRVYQHGDHRKAREAMMLGATLGGVAFSNASVALVHGMSRPIGAFYHVPHGLSNAMLLPAVTEFSIPAAVARYADCARAMGVAKASDSDALANSLLLEELYALNQELDVPTPKAFGIDEADFMGNLAIMAQQAEASGSPANNPRVPSQAEMMELYRKLW